MINLENSEVISITLKILDEHALCDNCLGRQFAWLGTGTSNAFRGYSLKLTLTIMADEQIKSGDKELGKAIVKRVAGFGMFEPAKLLAEQYSVDYDSDTSCFLCAFDGISVFEKIPMIANRMIGLSRDFEFSTFLVGSVPIPVLAERQDELSAKYSILYSETLKSHINRELGIYMQKVLEKEVDFEKPDVVFVYAMEQDEIRVQINPIFIYGRYNKLVRGIPQSRWDCKKCKGKGCKDCGGTGRKYPDSISEYVGVPAQLLVDGSKFKFHAAGREDIDVLMLGDGRPFVIEISEPRMRTLDLDQLAIDINDNANGKIEVHGLEMADRLTLQKLKETAANNVKEYRALITTQEIVSDKMLKKAEKSFKNIDIEQRTPIRVSHRRSDLVRKKRIHEVKLRKQDDGFIEGFFKVQGGTYIKELISGDEGRTVPSIAQMLDTPCVCKELNVTAIYSEGRK